MKELIWYSFSRPLHGLWILALFIPAVNCWATIIRPLCGLISLPFVQSLGTIQLETQSAVAASNSHATIRSHRPNGRAAGPKIHSQLAGNVSLDRYGKVYAQVSVDSPSFQVCRVVFRNRH